MTQRIRETVAEGSLWCHGESWERPWTLDFDRTWNLIFERPWTLYFDSSRTLERINYEYLRCEKINMGNKKIIGLLLGSVNKVKLVEKKLLPLIPVLSYSLYRRILNAFRRASLILSDSSIRLIKRKIHR